VCPPTPPTADARDVRLLDGLRVAAVLLDAERRVLHANPAALEFFATTRERLVGRSAAEALFEPSEQGPAEEVLTKVLAGTRWEGELPVTGREDTAGRTHLSITALHVQGHVDGALLLA
jgi:PAS domain S-box-containing protein